VTATGFLTAAKPGDTAQVVIVLLGSASTLLFVK